MNNRFIGLKLEIDIVNHINENKIYEKMCPNIQNFLKHIFNINLKNKEIHAQKFYENYKPDITITACGITKYISVKSGSNNSVHQEHIYSFINYMKINNELSEECINLLKEFHFNDGTISGNGLIRESATQFQLNNQDKIQQINIFFNAPDTISETIDRLLFKGEYYNIPVVDYLYYGTLDKGLWASRFEIISYLSNIKTYSASPHISKLYYQSLHRNLKKDLYYEYKRYYVQFKWHSLKEDLEYISNKRKKE